MQKPSLKSNQLDSCIALSKLKQYTEENNSGLRKTQFLYQ